MQKDLHPKNFREVAFKDITSGEVFIIKSTANASETITHEGKEYPLYTVDTSSASHPFYTGNRQSNKSTGRVERFNKRFAKAQEK